MEKIEISIEEYKHLKACEYTLDALYSPTVICPQCGVAYLVKGWCCPHCGYDDSEFEEWIFMFSGGTQTTRKVLVQ